MKRSVRYAHPLPGRQAGRSVHPPPDRLLRRCRPFQQPRDPGLRRARGQPAVPDRPRRSLGAHRFRGGGRRAGQRLPHLAGRPGPPPADAAPAAPGRGRRGTGTCSSAVAWGTRCPRRKPTMSPRTWTASPGSHRSTSVAAVPRARRCGSRSRCSARSGSVGRCGSSVMRSSLEGKVESYTYGTVGGKRGDRETDRGRHHGKTRWHAGIATARAKRCARLAIDHLGTPHRASAQYHGPGGTRRTPGQIHDLRPYSSGPTGRTVKR